MSAPDVVSHRLGAVAAIPMGEGRAFAVGDIQIAVFRLRDGLRATQALCPHAGGPLADGIVADSCVTCPLHGRRFDLETGLALNGPENVAVHEVRVESGEVWVRLS